MSRAMNLTLPEADVVAQCHTHGISISAIETLPSGGTHMVTTTSEGAEIARHKFKKVLIAGHVRRFAFYRIPRSR
jgi:hypothetical protein